MSVQRKQYTVDFKTKVALEAIRGMKTANEIASEYGVHPTQISEWKKLVLERIPELFNTRGNEKNKSEEALIATLYQQIGQLKVELDAREKKISAILLRPNEGGLSVPSTRLFASMSLFVTMFVSMVSSFLLIGSRSSPIANKSSFVSIVY